MITLTPAKQKSIKESNFEEIEKEVQYFYQNSPESNRNFDEINKILTSFDHKRASLNHSAKIQSLNLLNNYQHELSSTPFKPRGSRLNKGKEMKTVGRTSIKHQGLRPDRSFQIDSCYESGVVVGSDEFQTSPFFEQQFL